MAVAPARRRACEIRMPDLPRLGWRAEARATKTPAKKPTEAEQRQAHEAVALSPALTAPAVSKDTSAKSAPCPGPSAGIVRRDAGGWESSSTFLGSITQSFFG